MKNDTNNIFFIITAALIFILFLLLQPKILPLLFSIRRTAYLSDFVTKTTQTKSVDVQAFWKMREFYCPGSFVFDKSKNPFLSYRCKWMKSEDSLISEEEADVAFQKDKVRIIKNQKTMQISFVVPVSEMKKAIGYFDYNEKDKELVKDKYWFNKTIIHL